MTLPRPTSRMQDSTMIAPRALVDISLDESLAGDVFPYLAGIGEKKPKIVVIAPKYPTHDITTIDPELIRVNVDYGYRAALDTYDGVSQDLLDASDNLALAEGKVARARQKTFHSQLSRLTQK